MAYWSVPHLLHLIDGCGLLNGRGFHSAAVALLRPLEDALDCFAAVALVQGAAEQWAERTLKPSDAAKLWTTATADPIAQGATSLADYRRTLRGQFAHYMHCSYDLCLWDLFFSPRAKDPITGNLSGAYELNHDVHVIDRNAHAIDAHLTAHLLEFLDVLKRAYTVALAEQSELSQEFARLEPEIVKIMERHNEHRCQNVLVPPEWALSHP